MPRQNEILTTHIAEARQVLMAVTCEAVIFSAHCFLFAAIVNLLSNPKVLQSPDVIVVTVSAGIVARFQNELREISK